MEDFSKKDKIRFRSKLVKGDLYLVFNEEQAKEAEAEGIPCFTPEEIETLAITTPEMIKKVYLSKKHVGGEIVKIKQAPTYETAKRTFEAALKWIGIIHPSGLIEKLKTDRTDIYEYLNKVENEINEYWVKLREESDKEIFLKFKKKVETWKEAWERAIKLFNEGKI